MAVSYKKLWKLLIDKEMMKKDLRAMTGVSTTTMSQMCIRDRDKAAREREEVILKQLEEKEPLPDKEKDQMAWVRAANQHRAIAEEIILKELIYV